MFPRGTWRTTKSPVADVEDSKIEVVYTLACDTFQQCPKAILLPVMLNHGNKDFLSSVLAILVLATAVKYKKPRLPLQWQT